MSTLQLTPAPRLVLDADGPQEWWQRHGRRAGPAPVGRWLSLEAVLAQDAAVLRGAHARLVAAGEPAAAAAKYLVGWTAGAAAGVVGLGLATAGAGWLLHPSTLRWCQHPDGWFDAVDPGSAVTVPAGHPWLGQHRVDPVPSSEEVTTAAVRRAVEVLEPLVEACRRLGRVSRRSAWDEVADALGAPVSYRLDVPADPAVLARLTAAVDVPGVPWRTRPTVRLVRDGSHEVYVARKGGCCLAYTRPAGMAAPEPAYCGSCRFRDLSDCQQRQVAWLREQRSAGRPEPG